MWTRYKIKAKSKKKFDGKLYTRWHLIDTWDCNYTLRRVWARGRACPGALKLQCDKLNGVSSYARARQAEMQYQQSI